MENTMEFKGPVYDFGDGVKQKPVYTIRPSEITEGEFIIEDSVGRSIPMLYAALTDLRRSLTEYCTEYAEEIAVWQKDFDKYRVDE
jgi:hypothetical protein